MPQTFYIESDEEIISVIGRLRKTASNEILFVFPKRSLVLQSIINLRLLLREAEKCGKEIVIVSQDETGRMLAEKAGIPTENYSEDIIQKASHLEFSPTPNEGETLGGGVSSENTQYKDNNGLTPTSTVLGTSDFFGSQRVINSSEGQRLTMEAEERKPNRVSLRVRNASPDKLTALNSKRSDTEKVITIPDGLSRPVSHFSTTTNISQVNSSYEATPPTLSPSPEGGLTNRDRLKNFYEQKNTNIPQPISSRIPAQMTAKKEVSVSVDRKARVIFFVLGAISFLSLVSVGVFFLLPKVEVSVTPYLITQTLDKDFSGSIEDHPNDETTLSTRLVEKEKEVSIMITATGKSAGSGEKAHGTVRITNNYSSDAQPLIATTRFETSDGKLFRLEKSVVVPGIQSIDGKNEAGTIETEIVADQAGEEFNIKEPTSFFIPGFKGGGKYTQFTVQSTQAISGGGSNTFSDVSVISQVDIETAKRDAKEKAKELFLADVRNDMLQNEVLLEDQIEVITLSEPSLPSIGSVASTFEYKGSFIIKALLLDEQRAKEIMVFENKKIATNISFETVSTLLSYTNSLVDFSAKTYHIKVHGILDMESQIDKDTLRARLAGKKETEIQQLLADFPEVKNFKLNFSFGGFLRTVPNNLDRISIVVLPGEVGS